MSEKDSFLIGIISEIEGLQDFSETEKKELIFIVREAWECEWRE